MSESSLRTAAHQIFKKGLAAVDPAEAIQRKVAVLGDRLRVDRRDYDLNAIDRIFVVGTGKASAVMAQTVEEILGDRVSAGAVNVKYAHLAPVQRVHLTEAGHPIPDEAGVAGARKITGLLENLTERDLLLCLISGGGSALLPLPVAGVTLAEKQATTQLLLDCGASINELNTLRKHISQVKGGQLARLAAPAQVVSLILSDVIGDLLDVIASGPTVPDTSTFAECHRIIGRYRLQEQLPESVGAHLKAGLNGTADDTPKPGDPLFDRVQNVLIVTNFRSLLAAKEEAEKLGFNAMILSSSIDGETREVARLFPAIAAEIRSSDNPFQAPACIICGGETTVNIRGKGKGGRNQEFTLAAAMGIDGLQDVVVLSGGTDGTDGQTDAAGAIADGETISRAKAQGLEAEAYLNENDSYHFFKPLNDLIITGPTGTNVMDLRLLLVG